MSATASQTYLRAVFQEDSLQFFKEERIDGAVYNVYLKKVRYYTPDVGATVNHPSPAPPHDASNSLFYLNIAASTQRARTRVPTVLTWCFWFAVVVG